MIPFRRIIRDLFGFSRAQVNAFVIFLPLMIIILFSHPVYRWLKSSEPLYSESDRNLLDSLVASLEYDSIVPDNTRTRHYFLFNPNQVSEREMDSLGFPANLSARIARYREKGGRFRVKNDLLKIYGVDTTFYRSLYSYIQLPEKIERNYIASNVTEKKTAKKFEQFDLNLADTAQLKKIKGIGEKLSLRILHYRESLGGFTSMSQLNEVYGLDSTVVGRVIKSSFITENYALRRMNINKVMEKDLSAHPYISKSVAKAIVSYRFQHGEFTQVEELRNIPLLDATTIQKITPYLEFK
jgi:competence protein ComEA